MSPLRTFVLTVCPLLLVGLFYALTNGAGEPSPGGRPRVAADSRRGAFGLHEAGDFSGDPPRNAPPATSPPPEASPPAAAADGKSSLDEACRAAALALRPRLSAECRTLVRAPFVLAGDSSDESLARVYDRVILPVSRALSVSYFDKPPDAPILVLMFSRDESFHEHARRFDGRARSEYYGYYRREDRRIMLNASTGTGTLAHELTHALAHFDFPDMPEWFDEGLASLHEESEFSDDGRRISGQPNWRVNHLLLALRQGKLRPLSELVSGAPAVRAGMESIDYAHARYLCLYLQKQQLLAPFYRKLRSRRDDRTGLATLQTLGEPQSLDELEREFRAWVATLQPVSRRLPVDVERL